MRVRHWMTGEPVTVTPQTSILNARRLLRIHRIRHLPVVDGTRLVGMISDRDLLLGDTQVTQALSCLQSDLLDGRYRRVDTVMTCPVHVADADDSVRSAAQSLQRWRVSALPVVDHGHLVGIITTTDCLRGLLRLLEDGARPREAGILEGDPDWYKTTPMPPGDDRPGRPGGPAGPRTVPAGGGGVGPEEAGGSGAAPPAEPRAPVAV